MSNLRVGDQAPDFSIPAHDGKTYSLNDFNKGKLVLFFYPKDNTSGCTKEACSFRDNLKSIRDKGAVVIGVSADSPVSHQKFISKHDLNFTLLSDEEKSTLKSYNVWKEKSMYGRKYMGIERTTFIVDENGMITHIFSKVKVNGHVEEVLDALT